jgi:hypothetical protein
LFLDSSIIIGLFACKAAHNSPKTLDNALTGNKICIASYILPIAILSTPPPGTMQCKWMQGQVLSPSVQNRNHPSLISLAFPKLFKVAKPTQKANHKPI